MAGPTSSCPRAARATPPVRATGSSATRPSGRGSDMTELPPDAGPVLCEIARSAIATRVRATHPGFGRSVGENPTETAGSDPLGGENPHPWLDTPGAAFVTLTQQGALRGLSLIHISEPTRQA